MRHGFTGISALKGCLARVGKKHMSGKRPKKARRDDTESLLEFSKTTAAVYE